MARAHLNRLSNWQATISRAATGLRRPKTTTLSVFCGHCQNWVKTRRYNPVLYCCNDCEPGVTAGNASSWRTAQQAAELAHHLHIKRTRQWRRHTARVTNAV
jgi:hypothetical protein